MCYTSLKKEMQLRVMHHAIFVLGCIKSVGKKGKEFSYDDLERFWQIDDVNMKPERNGASERHANRPIYYINLNSDDHRVTYILKEYGIYWHQLYMQTYIWIIKLEGLNIQQFVNICAKDVAAKDKKIKIGNLKYMTSAMGYSTYMQILTMRGVAEPNNVTSDMGCFACTQILTNKGVTEQDLLDSDLTKVFKTLFADKGINFASKGRDATRLMPEQMSVLSDDWINILPDEVKRKFINMSKSIHPEDSLANFKLLAGITTSSDNTGEEPREFENTMAGVRCKYESTRIKLYRNIIRNETCRMMTSIDMVVSVAKHLFGIERTRIFFDLLDELFYFGSAGSISDFVPNMVESNVRQHVISFFEYACNMMNRLMTLLLGCPDSKRIQNMPKKKFISLMQSVIVSSSLKTETKGEKPSSKVTKGTELIMVDSEEFERAVGEDISEDVSDRLGCGDKMIVHRFVDTRLEKPQPSERREKKPIHSIYFPSDCRLFIYIPTENGSYWHQSDMRRASRIHQR